MVEAHGGGIRRPVNQTLGTKFTVQVTEANTVFQRHKSGDYQGSIWGWLGLLDPDEYMYDIIHTKGWRNFYGYSNPKVDDCWSARGASSTRPSAARSTRKPRTP